MRNVSEQSDMAKYQSPHNSATAHSAGTPPAELVTPRVLNFGIDALRHLEAIAGERNTDLQALADEAFADLLRKYGRDPAPPVT
jgi:hypothetical protein